MSKLYLNSDSISTSILPSIRSSINYLDKAISCFDSTSIPNTFSQNAVSKRNEMTRIKQNLENLEYWLNNSTKQLNDLEENMTRLVSSLPIDDIPVRANKVI